jgi:hypothetical protein
MILSLRNPGHKIDLNPIYAPAPDMEPLAVYRNLRPDYNLIYLPAKNALVDPCFKPLTKPSALKRHP